MHGANLWFISSLAPLLSLTLFSSLLFTSRLLQARDFSPSEVSDLRKHFKAFDADDSGSINAAEIRMVLKTLGESPTPDQLRAYIEEADTDKSGGKQSDSLFSLITLLSDCGSELAR